MIMRVHNQPKGNVSKILPFFWSEVPFKFCPRLVADHILNSCKINSVNHNFPLTITYLIKFLGHFTDNFCVFLVGIHERSYGSFAPWALYKELNEFHKRCVSVILVRFYPLIYSALQITKKKILKIITVFPCLFSSLTDSFVSFKICYKYSVPSKVE